MDQRCLGDRIEQGAVIYSDTRHAGGGYDRSAACSLHVGQDVLDTEQGRAQMQVHHMIERVRIDLLDGIIRFG